MFHDANVLHCHTHTHTHTHTRVIFIRHDTTEAVNTHAVTELESAVADKLANGVAREPLMDGGAALLSPAPGCATQLVRGRFVYDT